MYILCVYMCIYMFMIRNVYTWYKHVYIWNPLHLNVNRQIGTYWSVLVRTSLYQYQQVQEFPYWYKPVQDGTRQYQIS